MLAHLAAGKTDEEIAATLGISRNTVDTHMRHIFQTLDVNSRVTAVVKGIMLGLITATTKRLKPQASDSDSGF